MPIFVIYENNWCTSFFLFYIESKWMSREKSKKVEFCRKNFPFAISSMNKTEKMFIDYSHRWSLCIGKNSSINWRLIKTKAEIVICCVEFGLKQVSHNLFELALATNFYDEDSIKQFTEKLFEQKEELCWCYQVIASPNYNWLVKDIVINVRGQYKQYADKFEKKYGAETLDVKMLMGFAMLAVKEFIITEDKHCLQQFRIIIEKMKK